MPNALIYWRLFDRGLMANRQQWNILRFRDQLRLEIHETKIFKTRKSSLNFCFINFLSLFIISFQKSQLNTTSLKFCPSTSSKEIQQSSSAIFRRLLRILRESKRGWEAMDKNFFTIRVKLIMVDIQVDLEGFWFLKSPENSLNFLENH